MLRWFIMGDENGFLQGRPLNFFPFLLWPMCPLEFDKNGLDWLYGPSFISW